MLDRTVWCAAGRGEAQEAHAEAARTLTGAAHEFLANSDLLR